MDDRRHAARDPDPVADDPRGIPVDDPEGGGRLTRALLRWLPVAALAGALAGIPVAVITGAWRAVAAVAAIAVAVTGGVLAAREDGRVQREVAARDARTPRPRI